MADFNEKFRVVMLQGAKGEPYDDTQLRQDINEMLANVPYIKYTEDNGFELPIYTINDNSVTAYSCWSSQKITNEYQQVCYFNPNSLNNTIECDKTFNELISLEKSFINIQYFNEIITAKYHHLVRDLSNNIISVIIEGELINNGKLRITHNSNNTITYQEFESDNNIKRIKFIDVETNNGAGDTLFTCPNKPHLLNIVKKSTSTSNLIEYTNGIGTIASGALSGDTYPKVSLTDETGTTANTYGIIVRTFEQTSGVYIVAVAY